MPRSEDRVATHSNLPHAVHALAALLASGLPPDDFYAAALPEVCALSGCRAGAVYRTTNACRQVARGVLYGFSEQARQRLEAFPLHRSPSILSLCEGQVPYLTHEDRAEDVTSRFGQELGFRRLRWALFPMRGADEILGVFGVFGEGSAAFTEQEREALEFVAHLFTAEALFDDRVRGTERANEQLAEDLRFAHALLQAAESMAEKNDLREVLAALAGVVHRETGRKVLVTLVSRDIRQLSAVASAGWAADLDRQSPMSELDPVLRQALVERRPAVIEGSATPTALGMPSRRFLSVPLLADGVLMGGIEVDDPPIDREGLSREIRVLQGIAFEASAAIASARLYEQQRRSASLRQALNEINTVLNETIDQPELLQPVLERTVRAFDADSGVLALLAGDRWVAQHVTGGVPLRQGDELPDRDVANGRQALRTASPVLLSEASAAEDATEGQSAHRLVLVVPLQLRKRSLGAIFVRRGTWIDALDSETLDFATKLGVSVSLTLGNRYMYEHEHLVSETLQQALLSVPSVVPGIEMAHLYRAAYERTRVGGDFYDVFDVGGDKVAFVVGDVSGKGIDAAALTALAKNTIKAHAVEGLPPHVVLEKANEMLYQFSSMETFVTVFLGVVDTNTGKLRYSNGGHPPPLVFGPRGVRELTGDGALVGAFTGSGFSDESTHLRRGETLLLYTDGLTEARAADGELYGEERLKELVSTFEGADLSRIPEMLMDEAERFARGPLIDDVAILVISLGERKPLGRLLHHHEEEAHS